MDRRESAALDRYITGNYGEDQLKGEDVYERLLNAVAVAVARLDANRRDDDYNIGREAADGLRDALAAVDKGE